MSSRPCSTFQRSWIVVGGVAMAVAFSLFAGFLTAAARPQAQAADQDRGHWAYAPLRSADPPPAAGDSWARTPIDRFIAARLTEAGLSPAAPADARTLIRRVYFDLIGLPPTPQEVEAFAADPSPQAYERMIDQLLSSRHYGERWGRHWLDVARYADSSGQEGDADRPFAYQYRDFVIRAFNDDLPFDTFVRWQLAGDEYEPDNPLAVAATGFLTAGPSTKLMVPMEDEKLRNRYNELDDVLSTIGSGLLGLTVGCARCHDHKYDAIPSRDYYRMMSAFHGGDRQDVLLGTRAEIADYRRRHDAWQERFDAVDSRLNDWLAAQKKLIEPPILARKIDTLPIAEADKALLRESSDDEAVRELARKHAKAMKIGDDDLRREMSEQDRRTWDEMSAEVRKIKQQEPPSPPTALAFRDDHATPAETWFFKRGDYYDRNEPVTLGFLSVLTRSKSAADYWQDARAQRPLEDSTYQRRAMAQWITDVEHGAGALLARVIVNRIWQHHFGQGLVRTVDDFGVQGQPPTHPQLLEWLTDDFVQHGWRLKRLHRTVLTSAVYLQGTTFDATKAGIDPDNRLLWRQRPQRIEAEVLRDAILAVSGALNLEPYGPGFRPPIAPEALVSRNIKDQYPAGLQDGPQNHRRTVYMFHKRLVQYPLLQAFDAPDAQMSCGRRNDTTVAPQALAMLNDEFVRLRALDFADRLIGDCGHEVEAWPDRAYALALGRAPRTAERAASLRFLRDQAERRSQRDANASPAESRRLALADFCQTLFSLNEFHYVD